MRKLVYLLLVIIQISCMNSNERMVKQKLEEKYGEKFKIISHKYNIMLDYYQFRACSERNEDIEFVGDYKEGFKDFKDSYVSNYLIPKYSGHLEDVLGSEDCPIHVYARILYSSDISNAQKVHVDELEISKLNKVSEGVSCELVVFLFQELNDKNKEELLSGIELLIKEYSSYQNANFIADIYFFKKSFLNEHSISDFKNDGLNSLAPFLHANSLKKYVARRLYVMLDSQKPFKLPDVNDLYELTREVTPENFRIYPVSLNVE